jgi:tetratricopeptide (TPR) repeat protein
VYGMDIDRQAHRARETQFDQQADGDVLQRSKPRNLTGLDLAEAKLAQGDVATASALAHKALTDQSDTLDAVAQEAQADFILARVAIMTGHPDVAIGDFQKTIATSKQPRLVAWSHIYLGRMLDLDCKRDQAVTEYQAALAARDGQQDTRIAAERGVKTAYAVKGHSCDEDADDSNAAPPPKAAPGQSAPPKPQ